MKIQSISIHVLVFFYIKTMIRNWILNLFFLMKNNLTYFDFKDDNLKLKSFLLY